MLWPIWLWCSCAFPGARSHLLATEFSTFHPCFELTEICLFSQTGQLLPSPCLLQKKAKQVFSFRGLLEGRISERAARKMQNAGSNNNNKKFLLACLQMALKGSFPNGTPCLPERVVQGDSCSQKLSLGDFLTRWTSWFTASGTWKVKLSVWVFLF